MQTELHAHHEYLPLGSFFCHHRHLPCHLVATLVNINLGHADFEHAYADGIVEAEEALRLAHGEDTGDQTCQQHTNLEVRISGRFPVGLEQGGTSVLKPLFYLACDSERFVSLVEGVVGQSCRHVHKHAVHELRLLGVNAIVFQISKLYEVHELHQRLQAFHQAMACDERLYLFHVLYVFAVLFDGLIPQSRFMHELAARLRAEQHLGLTLILLVLVSGAPLHHGIDTRGSIKQSQEAYQRALRASRMPRVLSLEVYAEFTHTVLLRLVESLHIEEFRIGLWRDYKDAVVILVVIVYA